MRHGGLEFCVELREAILGVDGEVMAGVGKGFEHGLHKVFACAVGESGDPSEDVRSVSEALECHERRRFLWFEQELGICYDGWCVGPRRDAGFWDGLI